ncbi:MAG: DNA-binding protein [Haliea sp.]|nr:DNA-binding protein [Haliea sp.]MAL94035.1 DNA-binding protein [Haliea sp.]|tara:strand:- start:4138 stop:4581 length:444 start_codon:yes stop_codon:yes gene_type:complete
MKKEICMKGKPSALQEFAKSKTRAKAEARKLPFAELEKLIKSLNEALEAEKAKEEKKLEQERLATIDKINNLLADTGLKPEDLKKTKKTRGKAKGAKAGRKMGKVPPRYRLVIDGKEHLWSGRGRTPRVFQEYFDAGNSRESCEIQS